MIKIKSPIKSGSTNEYVINDCLNLLPDIFPLCFIINHLNPYFNAFSCSAAVTDASLAVFPPNITA